MRHKPALILPYYGTLPNYFPLWLKSAGTNPDFTFMIFTDCDMSGYNVPENVRVIHLTFDGLKKLIAPHLDFAFVLGTPYKLCDYRPMFGLIFADWLKGYDFWGHVDPDIIWGNMSRFITDDLLDKYSKLYRNGHLVLYRNTPEVNSFALHKLPYWNIYYKDIYTNATNRGFDESVLAEHLFSNFTVAGGSIIALTSRTFTLICYSLRVSGSANSVRLFRRSGGRKEDCKVFLSTVKQGMTWNICISISRRGP